jgi:hypothetical protein
MTEIGTAMSVIGAVTGSKDLAKFGTVMGLAGGIGGAINGSLSANPFDQIDAVGSSTASTVPDLSNGVSEVSSAMDASGAGGTLSDTTNAFGSGGNVASGVEQASKNATLNGGIDTSTTGANGVTGNVPSAGTVTASNPTDARLASGTQATPTSGTTISAGTGKAADSASSWFDKMTQFVKSNDKLSAAALQLGGSALAGMSQASQFDRQYALASQKQGWGNSVGKTGPTSIIQSVKGATA